MDKKQKWQGQILPSVLVMILLMFGYLAYELSVYRQDQESYRLTEQFYEGKVMSELTYLALLSDNHQENTGTVMFQRGKVSYVIDDKKVRLKVYLMGKLITIEEKEIVKEDTKKAIL